MERNREARRVSSVAVANGSGLSRRRQRNGGYRESAYGDAAGMEMMGRLRSKKDRSGRSKRRRGDRTVDASSNKNGVNSSSDSSNEEDDGAAAMPPYVPHHHHRRRFPMTAKAQPPAAWNASEEMIGVTVPRRARTSSAKRPHEFSSGGGELFHQQASTSPARPSTPVSPSSSSASVRKKMKPASGTKQLAPRLGKTSPVSEDLEIEVAEVLFGMTRQFPPRTMQEIDPKDSNGSNHHEAKSVVSPQPAAPRPSTLPPSVRSDTGGASSAAAPKRKRQCPVSKSDKESPLALPSTSGSSMSKIVPELLSKTEASSSTPDKNTVSPAIEAGTTECDHGVPSTETTLTNIQKDSRKTEKTSIADSAVKTEGADVPEKESLPANSDANLDRTTVVKCANANESSREVKFCIDLMALPPGRSSPEREGLQDYVTDQKVTFIDVKKVAIEDLLVKGEEVKVEKIVKQEAGDVELEAKKVENSGAKGSGLKKQIEKDRVLDLRLNFDKQDKDYLVYSKHQAPKQQQKATKIEHMSEIAAQSVSLPLSMVGGWPGSFPPVGYTSQVLSLQPVIPIFGSSGLSNTAPSLLTSRSCLKRCVNHCYIAQKIHCHQQLSRMNPSWPVGTCASPVYGGKHNRNAVPSSEPAILGNPLQGDSSKDKFLEGNTSTEPFQKKQLVLQQSSTMVSAASMPSSPAFVFALNQQQAAAAAAAVPAVRHGVYISNPGAGNAAPSSISASSAVVGSVTGGREDTMSFKNPDLPPNEAQYMAILQNSAYPFPIPAHIGAPPPYRGDSAQTIPIFHGSFYPSQMLYPRQLLQQQPLLPSHSHLQQGHQKASTSSSSSTSQKPPQQSEHAPGGIAVAEGSSYSFPNSKKPHQLQQHLPIQFETGSEDNPSTPSSRVPLALKNIYSHNVHPQNFSSISQTSAAFSRGDRSQSEKQEQPPHHQSMKVELTASQAFTMSFASFGGAVAATAPLQDMAFMSTTQNHPLFQSLPETARHGYQISMATAGATQAAQYKKPPQETSADARSAGDSMNTNGIGEERKMTTAGRYPASVPQHSLTISRPDIDPPISNILGSSAVESLSWTLNLIQAPANGVCVSSRPASAAPAASNCATTTAPALKSQTQQQFHQLQQQQLNNFQKQQPQMLQQQQMLHQQQRLLNRTKTSTATSAPTVYSDRLSAGSTATNFPQALAGFPQAFFQGSGTSQPPQWKTCTPADTPSPAASPAMPSAKNQPSQQQGKNMQQSILIPGHQTQISFGANSSKPAASTGQPHHALRSSNPSLPSVPSNDVGSTHRSGSKNACDSPRSSSSAKAGQSQATLSPLQQQKPAKKSPSSSQHKSSTLSNSEVSSIHGQLQKAPAPHTSLKTQQPPQHQPQLQKQQFPQAQFFFSSAYMPDVTSQSNGGLSTGYYHQRRQPEQPPQQQAQQNKTPGSMKMPSLQVQHLQFSAMMAQSAETSLKCQAQQNQTPGFTKMPSLQEQQVQFAAMMAQSAEASRKCLAQKNQTQGSTKIPSLQGQQVQFAAMMAQSAGAAAAASAFPYMHVLPSVKPADQKPAAGNDNLRASCQPEKK